MKRIATLTLIMGLFGLFGNGLTETHNQAIFIGPGPDSAPAVEQLTHIIGPGPTAVSGEILAIIIGPGPDAAPAVTTINA